LPNKYHFPLPQTLKHIQTVGRDLGELKGMDKWDEGGMLMMIVMLGSKVIMRLGQLWRRGRKPGHYNDSA
jgi:hypothetical protein